jgi:hypothetical protein
MGAAEPQVAEVEATNAVWCILERTSDTNVAAIGKSTVDVQAGLGLLQGRLLRLDAGAS